MKKVIIIIVMFIAIITFKIFIGRITHEPESHGCLSCKDFSLFQGKPVYEWLSVQGSLPAGSQGVPRNPVIKEDTAIKPWSFTFYVNSTFRKVRGNIVSTYINDISSENFIRNLYGLFISSNMTAECFSLLNIDKMPIREEKIRNEKLTKEEYQQFMDYVSKISGKDMDSSYWTYSLRYKKLSSDFENYLSLFKNELIYNINKSKGLKNIFREIENFALAEYIAVQTGHELSQKNNSYLKHAIKWHKWVLTGEKNKISDTRKEMFKENFNWQNLSLQDKKEVLAYTYVTIVSESDSTTLPNLLQSLFKDPSTKEYIVEIKNIIQDMHIGLHFKNKVLTHFPN